MIIFLKIFFIYKYLPTYLHLKYKLQFAQFIDKSNVLKNKTNNNNVNKFCKTTFIRVQLHNYILQVIRFYEKQSLKLLITMRKY